MDISEIVKNIRNLSFFILILVMILGFIYNSFFVINKGFRFIRKGKYKNAIEKFNKELESKPGNWRLFYGLAYCYFMLGFNRNALEFYKKTLELQPNKSLIYMEVAILYAELEKDFEQAKQYLEKAISVNKQKFYLFRSSKYIFSEIYGRIFLLQNDWERAQEYYKTAIPKYEKFLIKIKRKKSERLSPLYFRLGAYYLMVNKIEKAKKYFNLVMQLSSESFFADKSQEELKKIEKSF